MPITYKDSEDAKFKQPSGNGGDGGNEFSLPLFCARVRWDMEGIGILVLLGSR